MNTVTYSLLATLVFSAAASAAPTMQQQLDDQGQALYRLQLNLRQLQQTGASLDGIYTMGLSNLQQQENELAANQAAANSEQKKMQQLSAVRNKKVQQQTDEMHQQVSSNQLATERNSQELKSLRASFENMSKQLDGAFAESAALAGLVEPHNVGHTSFSVGLGYHESAQALALGVAERFTEQLTAKVGGAYDTATNTTTAYAGVGYEF